MAEEDNHPKSWLERFAHALLREPQDRQQLIELLRHAAGKKILETDALAMIEGVLQVSEMQVRDIMIPRAQMVVIEHDASPKEFLPIIIKSKHSRFPVTGEDKNEVIGIVLAKDLLRFALHEEEKFDVREILRPAVYIPESKRLNVLLREFRATRNHMAIVVDEYGNASGLVTIEDVLEQIVGEIEDEYDIHEEETNIKQISKTQYNIKAQTAVTDFNHYFGSTFSEEEFDTIGGIVLQQFGHLPKRGESVTINKFTFKVLHADNRRIRLLRLTLPSVRRSKKTVKQKQEQ